MKPDRMQDGKYRIKTVCNVESHEERSRRALLLSCEDVERMALESSRARLMMQLVSKSEDTSREFGSYFRGLKRGGLNNESEHVYVMTSHTSAVPIPKRIVPTYPSMVQEAIRWSPNIGLTKMTYSEESQTEIGKDDLNFKCKCHNCKTKHCLGSGRTNNIRNNMGRDEDARCFVDNAVKFSDNSTMTPKLADIGCGSRTPLPPTPVTSEVSIATSESHRRDHILTQSYKAVPIPILKKPRVTVTRHEPVRDSYNFKSSEKFSKSSQKHDDAPTCPNNSENTSDCEYRRKIIYNEGISDSIKNMKVRYPVPKITQRRATSPGKLMRNFSKSSVGSQCSDREASIPFAHRERSKYHSHCKPSSAKLYRCEIEDNMLHRVERPNVYRKPHLSKDTRCTRTPIQLPKKVLTSERDIESFIDKGKEKRVGPPSLFRPRL